MKAETKPKTSFLEGLKSEFKKISWTKTDSKVSLIFDARLVVVSIFVFGFGIFMSDLLITTILGMVKKIVASLT